MFKKLRNRFMAINMLSLSVVVVVALAGIYLLLRAGTLSANAERLQKYQPVLTFVQSDGAENSSLTISQSEYTIPADYTASFRMLTDMEGNILQNDSPLDLDEPTYADMARRAVSEPKGGTMEVDGKVWQYSVAQSGMGTFEVIGEEPNGSSSPGIITHSRMDGQLPPISGGGQAEEAYTITCLDVSDSYAYLNNLALTLLLVGLGMLGLLFITSFVFAKQAIKPIASTWESQKQFVDNASHELKTPLAIINANMEAMLSSPESTVAEQRKWIDHSRQAIDRSARLIDDMLQLSAMENPGASPMSAQDMSEIVNNSIYNMEAVIFERGLTLRTKIQPGINVYGNADNLARLATILLENAVKYCDEGGSIEVSLAKAKLNRPAVFSVYNTGQGIAEQDLPRLFDRFYRGSHSNPGHGLGLSLAKAIADSMGARIEVQTVVGEYTRFIIGFPAS